MLMASPVIARRLSALRSELPVMKAKNSSQQTDPTR